MTNIIPFRPRGAVVATFSKHAALYVVSLEKARALGVCPDPANDTTRPALPWSCKITRRRSRRGRTRSCRLRNRAHWAPW